ncbi:MAG: hypothetical protein ACO2PL_19540, partial [Armatimonadota bacterium]
YGRNCSHLFSHKSSPPTQIDRLITSSHKLDTVLLLWKPFIQRRESLQDKGDLTWSVVVLTVQCLRRSHRYKGRTGQLSVPMSWEQ